MSPSDNDQRLSDASNLNAAIHSLANVDPAQRQKFVLEKLIVAIDDIIKKRHFAAEPPFTAAQIDVLKDIVSQIFYITDPMNKPNRGFFFSLHKEFKEQTPMGQIRVIAAVVASAAAIFAASQSYRPTLDYISSLLARTTTPSIDATGPTHKQPPEGETRKPSANSPPLPMLTLPGSLPPPSFARRSY
ncbi:MAG: hypothetical protein WB816_07450 [Methylocystis sp.]